MTKILSIGLGGVGIIGAYGLQEHNEGVEVTAVIRLDYDKVTTEGYTISSIDYGGIKEGTSKITGFKPKNIVKSIANASEFGPFDYIIVSTKLIPTNTQKDVWHEIANFNELMFHEKSAVVLIQNGIFIEEYWENVIPKNVTLISGVSYIASVNSNGFVTQSGHDLVLFGLFDNEKAGDETSIKLVEKLVELYGNEFNTAKFDANPRFTRWKKLLYNASFNTTCCLTDVEVGRVFELGQDDDVIVSMMQEVKLAANKDLENIGSSDLVTQGDIDFILNASKSPGHAEYEPSMLVDFRSNRSIELEIILGNVIRHFNAIGGNSKKEIPYLNLTYHQLKIVQYGLTHGYYAARKQAK